MAKLLVPHRFTLQLHALLFESMAFLSLLLQAQVPVLFHGFIEGRIEQSEAGLVEVVIWETCV